MEHGVQGGRAGSHVAVTREPAFAVTEEKATEKNDGSTVG